MKMLFDQNLSPRLPRLLKVQFPDSIHVRDAGLRDADDSMIWDYAEQNGFAIVSKDSDFETRSLTYGHPPKFLWLQIGNCSVKDIQALLQKNWAAIESFGNDPTRAYLTLP
jgi:predicted nuclease of predicted toxin-antitoxin system